MIDSQFVSKDVRDAVHLVPEGMREGECRILRPDFSIIRETWTGLDNHPVHGYTARWTHRGQKYGLRVLDRGRARVHLATACLLALLDRDLHPEHYVSAAVDQWSVS